MKALHAVTPYLLKYKWRLLAGILIIIAARVFAVINVDLVGDSVNLVHAFIDNTIDKASLKAGLLHNILMLLGATLLTGIFTFLMRQLMIVVSRYIEADLKNDIYQQYQKLTLSFYKNNRTGDLMNRISEDVGKVRMYVGPAIMYLLTAIVLFATVIPVMISKAPTLTVYILIPLPILAIAIYNLSKAIHKRSTIVQEYLSKLTTFTQESFSGISVIKAYGIEDKTYNEFKKLSIENRDKNLNLVRIQAFFFPLMIALIGISVILVIWVGGNFYREGKIKELGTLVEFIMYVAMLTWPVATVGWVTSIIQQAAASQKRINEFLGVTPDIINTNNKDIHLNGKITFNEVSFTYKDTGITALQNISFTVNPGETLAIIGKTGSGKSTILELIGRLYDAQKGTVKIDNSNIKDINLSQLRLEMGYVPQDAFLFSDTIKENIKFGDVKATDQEVQKYAKIAHVHHNISDFKEGYDTILGERGITLSGGQKQRVSIARALIGQPKILLLDDCLSAVDTETEEQILSNLHQLNHKTTCIIVSHRISSAKNADKIIVVDNGKLTQQGTHNELITKEGIYKELYLQQTEIEEN